jgi:hypothetical protein
MEEKKKNKGIMEEWITYNDGTNTRSGVVNHN